MRVLIVTFDAPLYVAKYIGHIINLNPSRFCGVIAVSNSKSFLSNIKDQWNFLGFQLFIYRSFQYLIYKTLALICWIIPIKPFFSISRWASYFKISFQFIKDINSEHALKSVKSLKPDIILSVASPQKFGENLIKLAQYGCFNVHSSLLPNYRGINALFWALLNNEKKTGVTVHKIDNNFDSGPIWDQKEFTIEQKDSLHNLYEKAIATGTSLVKDFLDSAEKNNFELKFKDNPQSGSSYYSRPNREDRINLYKMGKKIYPRL